MFKPKDNFGQVKKLLKENNLKPQSPVDRSALVDDLRFLVIPCQDDQGRKWLFKIQYLDEPAIPGNFLNEVEFLPLAQRYQEVAPHVPFMKNYGWLGDRLWYLREFIEGNLLGKDEETFPYDKAILSQLNPQETARFFYNLAKIPQHEALSAIPKLRRYDLDWQASHEVFLKTHPVILKIKEKKIDYLTAKEQERWLKVLLNPPSKILASRSWALNHANLSPTNILFSPLRNLVFIDWENVCWGFRTSGFGEFWYRSLNSPEFQKEFFKARLSLEKDKEDFLRIFYFSLVVGNPGLLDYLNNLSKTGKIEKRIYKRAASEIAGKIREGISLLEA